jgi:AcrR family transcriptional regulator
MFNQCMTLGDDETPKRGRGRPRSPGAEQKILHAALEEYTEHGWAGFTMDGVARRAGFGKSTLYLRWADKDALLTDAVRLRSRTVVEVDTGSLRGDLTALATAVFHEFADSEGWAGFRMVVDSASASQPLGQFTRQLSVKKRPAP